MITTGWAYVIVRTYVSLGSSSNNKLDWLWKNMPLMHKDKFWEMRNSIIQSVIFLEGLEPQTCNSLWIYSYLLYSYKAIHSRVHS